MHTFCSIHVCLTIIIICQVIFYLIQTVDPHTSRIYIIPNMIKDMIEKVTFKMEFSSFFYFYLLNMSLCIVYIIVCEKVIFVAKIKIKKNFEIIFVLKRNDISNLYFVVYVSIQILPKKNNRRKKNSYRDICEHNNLKTTKTLISVLPGITWIGITISKTH